MYYEATGLVNYPTVFSSFEELFIAIRTRQSSVDDYIAPYHLLKVQPEKGEPLFFVSDTHIDNTAFSEVAVLVKCGNEPNLFYQVESLSFAWYNIRDFAKDCKAWSKKYANSYQKTQLFYSKYIKALNLDGFFSKTPQTFTCGCCGNSFKSTLEEQQKYDQDTGYGYCDGCANE